MTTPSVSSGLTTEQALALLLQMLRVRRFEERCVELYSAAEIRGFMHLAIGQEAVTAGVIPQLGPEDRIVATYRDHAHALVRGVPAAAIIAEMLGRTSGCSGGRGGSMHLFDADRRFFGGHAIVGGGLPLAVGLALADLELRNPAVTACFFGEGAVAEGEFHESMNLAAIWNVPVLFCCENNLYAMGTALSRSQSQTDIALKASAYGMVAERVDGMDVLAVERAARSAVSAIRGGSGPQLLELMTYRFRAHSMYDPERYRSKEEVALWKERDPIPAFIGRAVQDGVLDDDAVESLEAQVAAELDAAVELARAGELEPVEHVLDHVVGDPPS